MTTVSSERYPYACSRSDFVALCPLHLPRARATRARVIPPLAQSEVERTFDVVGPQASQEAGQRKEVIGKGLACNLRHRLWLQRGRKKAGAETWRPRPTFRIAARRWAAALDNVVRVNTELEGLRAFCPFLKDDGTRDAIWEDSSWRQWRHLLVAMDLGSDGLTASNYLLYDQKLCMQRVDDFSHGGNCDVRVMLKGCGYWSYWLLQMVSFNTPFGPHQDNMRRTEIKEQMELAYQDENCESCVLFSGMAAALIEELRRNGIELPNEKKPEQECWEVLRQDSGFRRVGQRLEMARFQDSVKGGADNLHHWERDKFARTFVCLEKGWLRGKKLERLVVRESAGDIVAEGGGRTSALPQLGDSLIRSCAQNAVVISALLLSDDRNRRLSQCILAACMEVRFWHGRQSVVLKSTKAAQDWLLQQIGPAGDYLLHVQKILQKPGDQGVLESAGFVVSPGACDKMPSSAAITEDEFAGALGELCMCMAAARLRRGMWLFGWPMKFQRMLIGDPRVAEAVVERFKVDNETWQAFLEYDGQGSADKAIRKRSWFNFTSVRQLALAFQDLGWAPHREIEHVLRSRSLAILATQAVEEMIGVQKQAAAVKKCQKHRRPETAMHAVVASATTTRR